MCSHDCLEFYLCKFYSEKSLPDSLLDSLEDWQVKKMYNIFISVHELEWNKEFQ